MVLANISERMKAVIYARVSTQDQVEKLTIDAQVSCLQQLAQDRGYEVVQIYQDKGQSGAWIEGREGFQRLLEDIEKKRIDIDVILVTEESRLLRSSDPLENALIEALLIKHNIKIISPTSETDATSFEGGLLLGIKQRIASHEREVIKTRLRRGKLQKLAQGNYVLNSVPYGFSKRVNRDTKPYSHRVVHNPNEIRIIKLIYTLIVNQHKSMDDVADELRIRGLTTRQGKQWRSANISRMLKNTALTGVIWANRKIFKMRPGKKYDYIGERPRDEWIKIEVEPVLTESEYNKLTETIKNNRRYAQVKREPGRFLLRGLIRCSHCGAPYRPSSGGNPTGRHVTYYVCANRLISQKREPNRKRCQSPYVNSEILDTMIYDTLFSRLINQPKKVLQKWMGEETKQDYLEHLQAKLTRIDKDITGQNNKLKSLLDLHLDQTITKYIFIEKQAEIEAHRELLEQDKVNLEKQITDARLKRERNESLQQGIEELQNVREIIGKALVDPPWDFKQKILKTMLGKDGYIEIVDGETRYVRTKLSKRRLKVNWDYIVMGSIHISEIVRLIREFSDYKNNNGGIQWCVIDNKDTAIQIRLKGGVISGQQPKVCHKT